MMVEEQRPKDSGRLPENLHSPSKEKVSVASKETPKRKYFQIDSEEKQATFWNMYRPS
jgi:hypothetical protein